MLSVLQACPLPGTAVFWVKLSNQTGCCRFSLKPGCWRLAVCSLVSSVCLSVVFDLIAVLTDSSCWMKTLLKALCGPVSYWSLSFAWAILKKNNVVVVWQLLGLLWMLFVVFKLTICMRQMSVFEVFFEWGYGWIDRKIAFHGLDYTSSKIELYRPFIYI